MRKTFEGNTFLKTSEVWYWACTTGVVTRTVIRGLKEKRVNPFLIDGTAYVRIEGVRYSLKCLIATLFIPGYDPFRETIELKDGDPLNCSLSNLKVMSRFIPDPCISIQVISPEGQAHSFGSMKEAAKTLYISQSLIGYYIKEHSGYGVGCMEGYKFIKGNR